MAREAGGVRPAPGFGNAGERPARSLELFVPGGSEGCHVERAALDAVDAAADTLIAHARLAA